MPTVLEQPDMTYKVILLGNSGVGKTNLLARYADNTFDMNSKHTIGVELERVELEIEGRVVRVDLWDTAGQERFKSLNKVYFRGAHGVIIVYDITNSDSFKQVGEWYHMATSNGCDPEACTFLLVGNKVDLAYKRSVNTTDGIGLATNYQMNFFETSAKDATNVEKAFQELIYQINDLHLKIAGNSKTQDNSEKVKLEGRPVNLTEDGGTNNPLTNSKKGACCK